MNLQRGIGRGAGGVVKIGGSMVRGDSLAFGKKEPQIQQIESQQMQSHALGLPSCNILTW